MSTLKSWRACVSGMNVERGFRRMTMLVSIILLVVGIAADVFLELPVPHWIVHVALRDGRQTTLHLQWVRHALKNREYLAEEVAKTLPPLEMKIVEFPNGESAEFPAAMSDDDIDAALRKQFPRLRLVERYPILSVTPGAARITGARIKYDKLAARDLVRVDVSRQWSLSDGLFTLTALSLVALLSMGFFSARWVARGFGSPEGQRPERNLGRLVGRIIQPLMRFFSVETDYLYRPHCRWPWVRKGKWGVLHVVCGEPPVDVMDVQNIGTIFQQLKSGDEATAEVLPGLLSALMDKTGGLPVCEAHKAVLWEELGRIFFAASAEDQALFKEWLNARNRK